MQPPVVLSSGELSRPRTGTDPVPDSVQKVDLGRRMDGTGKGHKSDRCSYPLRGGAPGIAGGRSQPCCSPTRNHSSSGLLLGPIRSLALYPSAGRIQGALVNYL